MIKIKTGDLFDAKETIIAHQVNCFGAAGGLAAAVFEKYPDAENDYNQLVQRSQPWSLLGFTQITGQQKDGHIIANLYGQYQPGADYQPQALKSALKRLAGISKATGWSVAIPYKISCGICGGDWDEVKEIIDEAMQGVKCTIYRRRGDE